MLKINLINQYDDSLRPYKKTLVKVLKASYQFLKLDGKKIINIILVNNDQIQLMNRDYRHKDTPTDVISFENNDDSIELGDVFISIDKAKEQAMSYGHPFERELGFLAVHGFLHCNGYDHLDLESEKIMFQLQDDILIKCRLTR